MTFKVKRKKSSNWVDSAVEGLRKREGITRLQGNPLASIFLIGPVPGKRELDENLPWCDLDASRFFNWVQNNHNLKSNKDFLIMPTTFDAKKPVKGNTDIGHILVEGACEAESVERIVCIGGDAFKTYFGYGRKPSMNSLVGNVMFLEQVNYKPVFVFPDLQALKFTEEMRFPEKRDFYRAMNYCQHVMKSLDKLTKRFSAFLKTERPNIEHFTH